jgi:hypothetical protein
MLRCKRESYKLKTMQISPEQRKETGRLLKEGKEFEAVRYLQDQLGFTPEEALNLCEALKPEIRAEVDAQIALINQASRRKDPMLILGGVLAFLVGSGLLTGAGYIAYNNLRFASHAVPAIGKVIAIDEIRSTDSSGDVSLEFYPIVEYEYEGTTNSSSFRSTGSDYYVGERIEILVDTENPGNVLINTFTERWLMVTVLGGFGLTFFAGGCAGVWLGFRF